MNTSKDRISRWTPAIFACALANLMIGLLFAISGFAWPEAPVGALPTLAMVHFLTIGWLTLLMFGALFQFVPVITTRNLPNQILPLFTLIGVELGLFLMVAGFLTVGQGSVTDHLLPAGGALVLVAILIGGATLLVPLLGKRPRPLSADFVLAGLGFLLLTVLLGLCFACALTIPASRAVLVPLFPAAVPYHVVSGVGGWFTLTAIGVSYELLPMFMLAPHERGVLGRLVLGFGIAGFVITFGTGIAMIFSPAAPLGALEQAGRAMIVLALVLYLADLVRLYRDRKRKKIELHNRAALGAFAGLGVAVLLAIWAGASGQLHAAAPFLVLLLLLGWLSGLGLTQLYKIVPFLSWLQHFGSRLGRGPVPRVQDLVDETGATPLFALYFAAVAALIIAAAVGRPDIARAFTAVVLLAVLLLAREYARAWSSHYAHRAGGGSAAAQQAIASRIKGAHT
ncbi:MAG: hypothetical protein ACREFP_03430 [Acetobacteraceae bacterium]